MVLLINPTLRHLLKKLLIFPAIIAFSNTMNKIVSIVSIALLVGCAAPPPVRIASSILSRTVLKKAREQYQQDHPNASPTPSPSPTPAPQS